MDGQDQSGAGYGDGGMDGGESVAPAQGPNSGGGMDSSGGTGGTGERQQDQSVQRSETIEAEEIDANEIAFEADEDLIDNDDGDDDGA